MLLDTCVLIDLEQIDLSQVANATALVSAVTMGELGYGLDTNDPVERAVRSERYYETLNRFDVLPFDTSAAKLYGTMAALVRQAGRDPRPRRLDLQIAATAAANSLPLVTSNGKDFVGLERVLQVIEV
ncbi:MAG TPA: type II toxin-antitoxin system VapC family toxin [Amycolatopsis sp.]|uniref:type II toxin-antitoxin system VapC family toxin n=1 Tax=Amycolatopsis sp. TaxID=37632 RepID=UPI002B47D4A4|nr:type II toxin-antitoxin system VapC family toxin [Amycolatopsis sp.]HKS48138.1 type II toxin-antitoxin system VapC family toxin [Amycolatopsis sp.]